MGIESGPKDNPGQVVEKSKVEANIEDMQSVELPYFKIELKGGERGFVVPGAYGVVEVGDVIWEDFDEDETIPTKEYRITAVGSSFPAQVIIEKYAVDGQLGSEVIATSVYDKDLPSNVSDAAKAISLAVVAKNTGGKAKEQIKKEIEDAGIKIFLPENNEEN